MREELIGYQEKFFEVLDEFGPEKILYVYDPKTRLRGILVVDNITRGPAIGGLRMTPNVSIEEVLRLTRTMTFKNTIADLPHGGGKGGIIADPSRSDKHDLIRSYARAIEPITNYIPGPDMGTDERCMALIKKEIGRAEGLPRELGGIPLDEIGVTGFGVTLSTEVACEYLNMDLSGSTVAIKGFGAVGKASCKYLSKKGARIIAVSDSQGTIYNPDG